MPIMSKMMPQQDSSQGVPPTEDMPGQPTIDEVD